MIHEDYLRAAETLWGEAGRFAVIEYQRINEQLFGGDMPPLPIMIGLTAYGRCIGLTLTTGSRPLPRITLAPEAFQGSRPIPSGSVVGQDKPGRMAGGENVVRDTLVHEMVHARLMLDGRESAHNSEPWCEWITKLSPKVLNHSIVAKPVKVRRVDGKVTRKAPDGQLTREHLATWPGSLRAGYPLFEDKVRDWDPGKRIWVDHVY